MPPICRAIFVSPVIRYAIMIVENVATRRQVSPLMILLVDVSVIIWLALFPILIEKCLKTCPKTKLHLKLYNVNRVYAYIKNLVLGCC